MSLKSELAKASAELAKFAEALQVIHDRPKYEPQPGQNSALDFLKSELAARSDETEKLELMGQAQRSHEQAKLVVERLAAQVKTEEAEIEKLYSQFTKQLEGLAPAQQRLIALIEVLASIATDINKHSHIVDGTQPISNEIAYDCLLPDVVGGKDGSKHYRIGQRLHGFKERSKTAFG